MDIQSLINTALVRVKLVTFVHYVLIVGALTGHWMPNAYLFYNVLFIIALFWTIHAKDSIDAVHIAALINASSFLFDLICIIADFPSIGGIFSVIFAILNLAVRPFSLLLLHRELVDRGGNFVIVGSNLVGPTSHAPRNYEDIDQTTQSVPGATF